MVKIVHAGEGQMYFTHYAEDGGVLDARSFQLTQIYMAVKAGIAGSLLKKI